MEQIWNILHLPTRHSMWTSGISILTWCLAQDRLGLCNIAIDLAQMYFPARALRHSLIFYYEVTDILL